MRTFLQFLILVTAVVIAGTAGAAAQTVVTTKILDNGPDGRKLTFAVLGDGYTQTEQDKYRADVDALVLNGLLAHDFYRDARAAFNVYRVDLASNQSGVSSLTVHRDTALGIIFSGEWSRCWLEGSANTDALIDHSVANIPKYPDYILVIANEDRYGGCHPGGNRLFVTSGSGWEVVAHEYGHGIGNLYDEYWNQGAPAHDITHLINNLNCSSDLDMSRVIWKDFLTVGLSIPPSTQLGPGIDPNATVGMFSGCDYESSGIYRPAFTCRMRETDSQFCPVCRALMKSVVAPFLSAPAPPPIDPSQPQPTYLNLAMKVSEDGATRLVKVQEIAGGQMTTAMSSSDFVYEVTRGNQTVKAGSLAEDPFVMRGFVDPNHNQGEMRGLSKSATIIIRIPNLSISDAAENDLGLRFYRLRSEDRTMPAVINPQTFLQLKEQNLLDKKFTISPDKLKTAAREIGLRSIQ